MKKFLLILGCLFFYIASFAAHLKGGWIQYEYLGAGASANSSSYRVTVKQYLLCTSSGGPGSGRA